MPLKILLLSHTFYPKIGGIEGNSELLAEAFSDEGHQVRLLTWPLDVTGRVFPYAVVRNPGIRKLIREYSWADVVFENNPCLRLSWPNLFFARPSVIALNTWIARPDGSVGIQDKLKKIWLKRANKVISVSSAIQMRCWPKGTVIGNPYRADRFRRIPTISRNCDFIFLGRLVSDKGADQTIHALYHLLKIAQAEKQDVKSLSLTIVGDGPERENLRRLVTGLNLEKHVHFTGSLQGEELVICLNRHRFLLVPSLWEEPFGNVVLEAMACGCVPIVSDGGGLPEAVGDAGLTFARGNVNALVKCIQGVYNDPAKKLQLLNAAKTHLVKHDPALVSKRYLEVIEDAVKYSRS